MLARLRFHTHAPIYRNYSGHRLLPEELPGLHQHSLKVAKAIIPFCEEEADWLLAWLAKVLRTVPAYRKYDVVDPAILNSIPTISRQDLSECITQYVPDDQPLARLICFTTSGTSGHPLRVPSHPVVTARYLAYHQRALHRIGVSLQAGAGQVGVVLAGYQQRCFTYVSVNPLMQECGLTKINLWPDEWHEPSHRKTYLDDLAPELVTGDPISLSELARLGLTHAPKAVLSTSMTLLPGMRVALESALRAPVLDIYSMNEVGPIAVFDPALNGHVLLQPELLVEILDKEGRHCAAGEIGEITVTGGFNPYLPLLRYRTGDYAALDQVDGIPVLRDLQGRPPVRFRHPDGHWLNNIEVTHALKACRLRQYALHQTADGALQLRIRMPADDPQPPLEALRQLFGVSAQISIWPLLAADKVVQYTSDLPGHDGRNCN
ncbi:capsule biosynthesis protein CapK [Chitinivorax sp. B]|uniref:capsule biosynthesis protein CapK n=1 Tax=Chitinivorax sp. B TaxID=2502235 RepID=UPI0020170121|nr:capsule biosynthesis protein CapK [Chitinivorax sp. B]